MVFWGCPWQELLGARADLQAERVGFRTFLVADFVASCSVMEASVTYSQTRICRVDEMPASSMNGAPDPRRNRWMCSMEFHVRFR